MRFFKETTPDHTQATMVAPGIRRLVANNPGPMTYRGTNTYLLDWEGGTAVLDPGPDDAAHEASVIAQAGTPIVAILLTHGHHDHWGGLAGLKRATGAPVYSWHRPYAPEVKPDVPLENGAMVGPLRAIHTPGHAPDHLCFAHPDGPLFSGDMVMGWSTTVVGGKGGDMTDYFASLDRLLATEASIFLPGHGPPVPEPRRFVEGLRDHRRQREAGIVAALGPAPVTVATLTRALYPILDPGLRAAAERNVHAHLEKLEAEGRAMPSDAGWTAPH